MHLLHPWGHRPFMTAFGSSVIFIGFPPSSSSVNNECCLAFLVITRTLLSVSKLQHDEMTCIKSSIAASFAVCFTISFTSVIDVSKRLRLLHKIRFLQVLSIKCQVQHCTLSQPPPSFSVQTFYPSNDKFKTHFRSRIYSSKLLDDNKSTILKSFFDSTISINKQIFKEDYEICSRVNKQEKHYIGPLAETEEKLIWYRKKLK